jgi:intermediate peptidase
MRDFDDISETLCKVVDPAELCRNVHSSPHFREAASQVVETISSYINQLNTNPVLYSVLHNITNDK